MPLRPGDRLGPYEILVQIGGGGMGEVYRALDDRLGRDVAIKLLPREHADDPLAVARFDREARVVATLSHPNIVQLYDVGRHDGHFYLVTELLEGEDLRHPLRRAPLSCQKATEIGEAVCNGLHAAHAKGIVHRDLKPENIFLTSDGQVKIVDFGVAHVTAPEQSSDPDTTTEPLLTRRGMLVGTVAYMAPEQVRGGAVTPQTDIFAFGSVLYEMVSGKQPFSRPTAAETIAAVLNEEPPELPKIPPTIADVLRHCLKKEPRERFASAHDVALTLRGTSSDGAPRRRYRWRYRAAIWVALLAIAVIGAAAAVKQYSRRTAEPITSLAILPLDNGAGSAEADYLGEGISESIISALAPLPDLHVVPSSIAFRYPRTGVSAEQAAHDLGARAIFTGWAVHRNERLVISAELLDAKTHSKLWAEHYSRPFDDIFAVQEEIAIGIAKAIGQNYRPLLRPNHERWKTSDSQAYNLYLQGNHDKNLWTPVGWKQALALYQQALARDPSFAAAHAGIAHIYGIFGFYHLMPVVEASQKQQEAARLAVALDPQSPEAHHALAHALQLAWWDGKIAEAEVEFKKSIVLNDRDAATHNGLGRLLTFRRKFAEAEAECRKAQDLDPITPMFQTCLADTYFASGAYDKDIQECRDALARDPSSWILHSALSNAYIFTGRHDDAIAEWIETDRLLGVKRKELEAERQLFQRHGLRGGAREIARRFASDDHFSYSRSNTAAIAMTGGDEALALDQLEMAYREHDPQLIGLNVNPFFDPLRSNPRFQRILEGVGFPLAKQSR